MASVAYRSRYDADVPVAYHAMSASLEETSPIKKAARLTRQRSSSTALPSMSFVRSASASDVGSTRAGVGPLRPQLPEFSDKSRKSSLEGEEDGDVIQDWAVADSDSLPSRSSLNGTSSRSSTSPNSQAGSSTSSEIVFRRSFKRSATVPSRPGILGLRGEGTDKTAPNYKGSPLDSVQVSDSFVPPVPRTVGPSTIRRSYITPIAASRTYRSTAGTQPQSLATHRYLTADKVSTPSSNGSSPGSDIPPVSRPLSYSSYHPRVLPSTGSAGRLTVLPSGGADGKELEPYRTHNSHQDSDLFEREGSPAHSDRNFEKELQHLQDLVLNMSEDEETSQQSPPVPAETATQRQKRKEPDSDDPSYSRSSPEVSPKAAALPASSHAQIPPIPPYRGATSKPPAVIGSDGGHQRSMTQGQVITTASPSIEPLSGISAARIANGDLRMVSDSQGNRLNSRHGSDRMGKASPVGSRHKRSPTAPSSQTLSSHIILGKENCAVNVAAWEGHAPRDRERYMSKKDEHVILPHPTSNRPVPLDKDRLHPTTRREREIGQEEKQRLAQAHLQHERELEEAREREREREKELREQQEHEHDRGRLGKEEADRLEERVAIAAKNADAGKAASLAERELQPLKPQGDMNADRPAPPPPGASVEHRIANQTRRILYVRKKAYTKLQCVGRGGSSRVYRVLDDNNDIYAIKRVTLERADAETIQGYQNEIQLLNRLSGQPGIIKLIDFESNVKKNTTMLVLECGEIDFATLLAQRVSEKFYQPQVACAWRQMLQAVHVIHEEKIVHSDLKPANFVMVKGVLKLIDFGIAKAIANDTTNIQRDQQIGTVNYMSPEAIEDTQRTDGKKVMKLGRASDVWSLGCILYQMVYGRPPFHSLGLYPKMKAIPDPNHLIEYPEHTTPLKLGGTDKPDVRMEHLVTKVSQDVSNSIKLCLVRDPKKRGTIPELLSQAWVEGSTDLPSAIPLPSTPPQKAPLLREDESIMTQKNMLQLLRYMRTLEGTKPENDEELSKELFANLKQVARQL